MAVKNNRRTIMTKRLLKTALIELMQDKPISKIPIMIQQIIVVLVLFNLFRIPYLILF